MLDRSTSLNLRLYDASCLNTTDYFNEVVASTQGYLAARLRYSINDLDTYINENFNLYTSGNLATVGDDSVEIHITNGDTGGTDTLDVQVVYQDLHQQTLCDNERVSVWVADPYSLGPTSGVSISWVCDNDAQLILAL